MDVPLSQEQREQNVEHVAGMLFRAFREMAEGRDPCDLERLPSYGNVARVLAGGDADSTFMAKVKQGWALLLDRGLIAWRGGANAWGNGCLLTERGRRTALGDAETWTEAPLAAIASLEAEVGGPLDDVVRRYLAEAIALHQDGHPMSCVFMLGVVAERIIQLTAEWLARETTTVQKKLERAAAGDLPMRQAIEVCRQALRELCGVLGIAELRAFEERVDQFATIYRTMRNDVGHPTVPPQVDAETAALQLNAMWRRYIPAFHAARRVLSLA